jgi:2-C-methyl-D-erythritol 2,4-cyclodiphosphate synthase
MTRTGIGFDVHALEEGRPLMIGCVEVPYDRGLGGHSDGDVLAHAICDALLGAAGLGDIGDRFPAEPRWANAAGATLLADVARDAGRISWIDATVVCAAPRLAPFRAAMREAIAAALGVDPGIVSVKATTPDGLGFAGRGEGIAAMAVATLDA